MGFEVQKSDRESNQGLVRRFMKRLRESGIIAAAKRSAYRQREQSPAAKKRAALRRLEKQAEYERNKKLGKI
ncbi:MAG: hypothetical protein Q8P39_03935 [Candidatus Yanofskybacteria bacterium]|nr:hypothetical protein [Candidatus Yanofskybacteria bacterium]